MKRKLKFLILILCAVMALSAFSLTACGDGDGGTPVTPPDPVSKVNSVLIYDEEGKAVGGTLMRDVSVKNITLTAAVQKTGDADIAVTFASSKPAVAEITGSGVVTLNSKGETVISASAGDKKHEIVLVVSDDYTSAQQFRIDVNDGTASASGAYAGSYITLTAALPAHKSFVRWEYTYTATGLPIEDLWLNGNIFAMPAANITITAIHEDMLYTLEVVNGTVKGDDAGEEKNDTTKLYRYKYGTEITTVANEVPDGQMLVGWEYEVKKNRVAGPGETEYGPFEMPGETLTVWAIFSEQRAFITNTTGPDGYNSAANGFKLITDGAPAGGFKDPDLDEMSGYRFAISPTQSAVTTFPENIQGTTFSNIEKGSQTIKTIFKNRHTTLSVTVEFYATYYGTLVSAGHVTVPANTTITKYNIGRLGLYNPWFGFAVRESVGGQASDGYVLLDMVTACADTYPDGDRQFELSGAAEYVKLSSYTESGFPRDKRINEKLGLTVFAVYAGNIADNIVAPYSYASSAIQNMPSFNAASPTTTVYFRVINCNPNTGSFTFGFSATADPNNSTPLGEKDIVLAADDVQLFAITVPRTATDNGQIYFTIMKKIHDSRDNLYGHNFVVQMLYNNVIGVV